MKRNNEVARLRREVIARTVRCLAKDAPEELDRIPLLMRPKGMNASRCCIYKDRAVLRYRVMTALGFRIEDETDEIRPLAAYAADAAAREKPADEFITIFPSACSACMESQTVVTNLCRGCLARPCEANCPRGAITLYDGRARIDRTRCVDCGLCAKACAFRAIVEMPLACEDSCPVGAVSKSEKGCVQIDRAKCIHCGRCIKACPFGAILQCNQVADVLRRIREGRRVTAMVAPAARNSFEAGPEKLNGALLKAGFSAVFEVSAGADVTARLEAAELLERLERGDPFMTTSCCPAAFELIQKNVPELAPYISHTRSPMFYTDELVKAKYPDAVTVFIGPCAAKRTEGALRGGADYVMTAEELGSLFMGLGIEVADCEPAVAEAIGSEAAIGFAHSGGVAGAVLKEIAKAKGAEFKLPVFAVNGLTEKTVNLLRCFARNKKAPGALIEIMACEGGCCAGPGML